STLVQVGDLVGWGLLYIDNTLHHDEEQLVICYLTVNHKILLVRVVYQPPGGFYPLVVLPPD
ncbi:SPRY domain-containing protein 3, partial [Elysia marginata]